MSLTINATPKKGVAPTAPKESKRKRARLPDVAGYMHARERIQYSLVISVTGVESENRVEILHRVKNGLPSHTVKVLEDAFHTTQSDIAKYLTIPLSTLRRRLKNKEKLAVDESDRVVRLARIKDLAVAMMGGNDDAAVRWLQTPRDILDNESPLEHASTELGAREVEDLIGRLQHGVFS